MDCNRAGSPIAAGGFVASAEARKLHTLAIEQAEAYAAPSKLVPLKNATPAPEAEDDEAETVGKGEARISPAK